MDKWLLVCFIVLLTLALLAGLYPLRQSKKSLIILIPLIVLGVFGAYWHWGSMNHWMQFLAREEKQKKIQAVLQSIKSPDQLVEKLKASLQVQPNSVRGWYLLGRLYASQSEWLLARDAFAKAYELNAQDEAITINYAQSLWQVNQQQFNETIRNLFRNLLQKNPSQPDALAMLAMDAFGSHHYQLAIDYWEQLLKLAPEQSQEAQMIRKAIAKAQNEMNLKSE